MQYKFKTVGEITITNTLYATENSTVSTVAMQLLSAFFQAIPVLNHSGEVIGKVTEMDLLKVLNACEDPRAIRVGEIMSTAPPEVDSEIILEQAIEIMDANRLTLLPVKKNNRFIGSIASRDLLRACLGIWVDHESYSEVIA